jgi:hypothetical protein
MAVLRYLEAKSHSGPDYPDDAVLPPGDFADAKSQLRREEDLLRDSLYKVLRRDPSATLGVLVSAYGVGTDSPSVFAVDLILKLHLATACPELQRSEEALRRKASPSPVFRQELSNALRLLGCGR